MFYIKRNISRVRTNLLFIFIFVMFFFIISEFDRAAQIEASQQQRIPSRVRTVVIDPGHGGNDKGIVSKSYEEKEVVLSIAERLRKLLVRHSVRAYLTRTSDKDISLNERIAYTNKKMGSVMVSIHVGTLKEVVLYSPVITENADKKLKPYLIHKGQAPYLKYSSLLCLSMSKAFRESMPNKGVLIRSVPYTILSHVESPSIIIELPSFDSAVYTEEFISKSAKVIIKGLKIYEERGLKGL